MYTFFSRNSCRINSQFKKDIKLQIHLHKAFCLDKGFWDSLHKSFLKQTTFNLRKEIWPFLKREFTVPVWRNTTSLTLYNPHLVMCSRGVDCTLLLQHSAAAAACGGNSSWSIFAKCEPTIIIIIKCRASTMCKIELESA